MGHGAQMLRNVAKDDIQTILDKMDSWLTFYEINNIFGLDQKTLSKILTELKHFKLISQNGDKFRTNFINYEIWIKYNRELDYYKLYQSDMNKKKFADRGVLDNDVPYYENFDFSEKFDEVEDGDIYEVSDKRGYDL